MVVIFGVGFVGMMVVVLVCLLGVECIFMIDQVDYCLVFVQQVYGIELIDFLECDFSECIFEFIGGCGVDVFIDVVGFEVKGSVIEMVFIVLKVEISSGVSLCQCIVVMCCGGVVVIFGVYVGYLYVFMLGDVFDKGLCFIMGQIYVQCYLFCLFEYVENGDLQFEVIIFYCMKLVDVVCGYEMFEVMQDECCKVVLMF